MKAKEKDSLNAKSAVELRADLHKTREQYFKLRFRHQTAPLKNPLQLRTLRRQVARLETLVQMKTKPALRQDSGQAAGGR